MRMELLISESDCALILIEVNTAIGNKAKFLIVFISALNRAFLLLE